MADWFLILAIAVSFGILLVASVYILILYSHPDDNNDAYFPKIVVILGFVLAGATVLLLPLDVANNEGYAGCAGYDTNLCGGINMELFWQIIYYAIPFWVFVLIPFSTFYYEADDGMLMAGTSVSPNATPKSKVMEALRYQLMLIVIVSLMFALGYWFLSETSIPVKTYNATDLNGALTIPTLYVFNPIRNTSSGEFLDFSLAHFQDMNKNDQQLNVLNRVGMEPDTIVLQVDLPTFFASLMAFIGWFFFALFGGIGLAALPLDLIRQFAHRPKHMDAVEFAEAQQSIRDRVNELVEIGEVLKVEQEQKQNSGSRFNMFSADARKAHQAYLEFKKAVHLLEQDVEDFQTSSENYNNYNPLIPYAALFGGIISLLLSILWVIQILIYVFPATPIHPFLNLYFQFFDKFFPLFGVLSVALFCIYLLFAAVKGCFKFGLRFLFIQLHPMKLNRTYMSSFMFNIGLILLCALPVVQFGVTAFADYARNATVRQVFGTQVKYLQFFSAFWVNHVFIYGFLIMLLLTTLYLMCKPSDNAKFDGLALRDRLKARRRG